MKKLELFNKTLVSNKACLEAYKLKWIYPILACMLSILFISVSSTIAVNDSQRTVLNNHSNMIQKELKEVLLQLPCKIEQSQLHCQIKMEPIETESFLVIFNKEDQLMASNTILFDQDGFEIKLDDTQLGSNYNFETDFFQNYNPKEVTEIAFRFLVSLDLGFSNHQFMSQFLYQSCFILILILFTSSFWTYFDQRKTGCIHNRKEWLKIAMITTLSCSIIVSLLSLFFAFFHWEVVFLGMYLIRNAAMLRLFVKGNQKR